MDRKELQEAMEALNSEAGRQLRAEILADPRKALEGMYGAFRRTIREFLEVTLELRDDYPDPADLLGEHNAQVLEALVMVLTDQPFALLPVVEVEPTSDDAPPAAQVEDQMWL